VEHLEAVTEPDRAGAYSFSVARRYGEQFGNAPMRRTWLAHLLRDATYADDEGDEGFALGFRFLLLRAAATGQQREALKGNTLAQYHADPQRRLDRLLASAALDAPTPRRLFRFICDAICPAPTMLASTHCEHRSSSAMLPVASV
jgi:hypothetical protein